MYLAIYDSLDKKISKDIHTKRVGKIILYGYSLHSDGNRGYAFFQTQNIESYLLHCTLYHMTRDHCMKQYAEPYFGYPSSCNYINEIVTITMTTGRVSVVPSTLFYYDERQEHVLSYPIISTGNWKHNEWTRKGRQICAL